jgi:hypothetical protein
MTKYHWYRLCRLDWEYEQDHPATSKAVEERHKAQLDYQQGMLKQARQ